MPNLQNLKTIRKARKMTQKELADIVGVSESSISQYESGAKSPSFEVALKIAEALDCESADLVTERKGLLNLIDGEDKKISATKGDGIIKDNLTDDQREAIDLIPQLTASSSAAVLSVVKELLKQDKSQDAQE